MRVLHEVPGVARVHVCYAGQAPTGDCYVELDTAEAAVQCLALNRSLVGGQLTQVFPVTKLEANRASTAAYY